MATPAQGMHSARGLEELSVGKPTADVIWSCSSTDRNREMRHESREERVAENSLAARGGQ